MGLLEHLHILGKQGTGAEAHLSCPKCSKPMIKKTKAGVTIDKCASCGGIWLDKGEIFKIIRKVRDSKKK